MTPDRASVLVALGGNVGDVGAAMQGAIDRLHREPDTQVVAVSPVYWTPPWGITDQPRFLNACAELETGLPPLMLLHRLQAAERLAGRERVKRWGPRSLDIDMVAFGDVRMQTPELTLPHPRMFERAFVLVPLADIAAERVISGRAVGAAAAAMDRTGIERSAVELRVPH